MVIFKENSFLKITSYLNPLEAKQGHHHVPRSTHWMIYVVTSKGLFETKEFRPRTEVTRIDLVCHASTRLDETQWYLLHDLQWYLLSSIISCHLWKHPKNEKRAFKWLNQEITGTSRNTCNFRAILVMAQCIQYYWMNCCKDEFLEVQCALDLASYPYNSVPIFEDLEICWRKSR